MNIVGVIGNGFDRNLGLNTSYQDFYSYYRRKEGEGDPLVVSLRKAIENEECNWSDLELGLGEYTAHIEEVRDVRELFLSTSEELCKYLLLEEGKINPSERSSARFFKDILAPENYLTPREKVRIAGWRNSIQSRVPMAQQKKINVITFNYTRVLERILGDAQSTKRVLREVEGNIVFNGVTHVHGELEKTPILGVNDVSQIANEGFHNSKDAMEVCLKPNHNAEIGHMLDERCADQIARANVICIYGSSIGDTDRLWWQKIGERLRHDCMLYIFDYVEDIPISRAIDAAPIKREVVEKFLSKTNLDAENKSNVRSRIYVGLKSEIFSL